MVSSGSMVARANEGFIYWGEEHPKTYLLAHNAVHALIANRMNGDAGFMAMWISPRKVREENWATCFCGWSLISGRIIATERISDIRR